MTAMPELPNKLFSDGRSVLSRFGYRPLAAGETRQDWAAMWDLLRPDFADMGHPAVPAYDALDAEQKAAARDYMSRRLIADRNLEHCEDLHVRLFNGGISTDQVERYSEAREAYEESVEAFGDAREVLTALLPKTN